mmetsp:Transcript_57589/g.136945  ORF Transcript_57589/g.136945 Transcript_57589/m.136945 type:complete len:145 (+) Transcript_57589:125-559(+)
MAKVKLPPKAREAAAKTKKASSTSPTSATPQQLPGTSTLLKQREEAKRRKGKKELTEKDRAERNRQLAKREAKKRLEGAFGASRDGEVKVKASLIPEEDWEDPLELAPTRRKMMLEAENLAKLTRQRDSQLDGLFAKALQNMKR